MNDELRCDTCNKHIGWISKGAGPRSWIVCDECHAKDEAKEAADD